LVAVLGLKSSPQHVSSGGDGMFHPLLTGEGGPWPCGRMERVGVRQYPSATKNSIVAPGSYRRRKGDDEHQATKWLSRWVWPHL